MDSLQSIDSGAPKERTYPEKVQYLSCLQETGIIPTPPEPISEPFQNPEEQYILDVETENGTIRLWGTIHPYGFMMEHFSDPVYRNLFLYRQSLGINLSDYRGEKWLQHLEQSTPGTVGIDLILYAKGHPETRGLGLNVFERATPGIFFRGDIIPAEVTTEVIDYLIGNTVVPQDDPNSDTER